MTDRRASTGPLRRAAAQAERQGGVVSRRQLYAAGVTRGQVRAQIRAGRWRRVGSQAVAVHTGPLLSPGEWWAALFEAGPRALLDGATSLCASGLVHLDPGPVRVSVPRGARVRRSRRWNIRQTRRFRTDDAAPDGVPRTRPAVAAVRAALWARTDREAALWLTATVQQSLATAEEVGQELLAVRRDRRRAFVHGVVLDLLGGVRSLGELDVVRECRRRGLPPPSRQVVRRTPTGTYVLDLVWEEQALVVEVDGIQHSWVPQIVGDALRQNAVTLTGARVLRLPLLGLRVAPDAFFAQIEAALRSAGWTGSDVMRIGRMSNQIA